MKKLIREFFFLRKGEQRALYFVLVVLSFSGVCRMYYSFRPLPVFEPDEVFVQHMEEIRRQVDSVRKHQQEMEKRPSRSQGPGHPGKTFPGARDAGRVPLSPVTFDPNTVSYDALVAMNLSAYVSRNIISYREAGASFREPADLARIYGLEEADYEALLPYVVFRDGVVPAPGGEQCSDASAHTTTRKEGAVRWTDTLAPLELNRADSADLLALPGIGPWFAGRIIRYRDLLGGYVAPEQLLEVYGMDTVRFNGIASFLTADTALIDRIDLNKSSFQEVISHPYINREETYAIFRYRDYIDSIPSAENILKDQIVDRDRFIRMAPYLTVKRQDD